MTAHPSHSDNEPSASFSQADIARMFPTPQSIIDALNSPTPNIDLSREQFLDEAWRYYEEEQKKPLDIGRSIDATMSQIEELLREAHRLP